MIPCSGISHILEQAFETRVCIGSAKSGDALKR